MFKNEEQPRIQRITTAVEKAEEASLDDLTDVLSPNVVSKLKEGYFKEWARLNPSFALLPHVLNLPIEDVLPAENVANILSAYTSLLDDLAVELPVPESVFTACEEILLWKYLLGKIDPAVPAMLIQLTMDQIYTIQTAASNQGELFDHALIWALRILLDPSSSGPNKATIDEWVNAIERLQTMEANDATSRELRTRALLKILFALKIIAPNRIPRFSAAETENLLKLDPWAFGWHSENPSSDEAMLRAMKYVIDSPRVWVDGEGLHVQRIGSEAKRAESAPIPIKRKI